MVKKRVILYGHANCGKSQTLDMLKDMLRPAGEACPAPHHTDRKERYAAGHALIASTQTVGMDSCSKMIRELPIGMMLVKII